MDTNMDKYLGTMLDDRYEILEVIGTGGMAVVYKAMCHRLNRYVAVKILRDELANDEEFRKRFQTEAQAVAMLSHPNIVSVYDVSHSDGVEYIVMELIEGVTLMQIVMELIEGVTLMQYMKKKGALGWKEALHFAVQISKALEHAHEKGIVHRDIKPQNIMILKDGTIKVADFGIAALESAQEKKSDQTVGSVHYIAPEQARGEQPDPRSDIYSLSDLEDFRKQQAAANLGSGSDEDVEILDVITPDVHPIGKSGELSKEKYARRRRRSRKVSILSGACGVLVFLIAVFVFLWNYWLRDIFSVAERINIPNFVGASYEDIVNSSEFKKLFNFEVNYAIDPDVPEGQIISQDPEADRSMMVVPEGIDVSLTVSTGVRQTVIPDVTNKHYQEATIELQNAGFIVEIANTEASDAVTVDYVISTDPAPGEELAAGSTVFLTVSAGPSIKLVTMPNLVGSTEKDAIARIESSNLSYGDTTYIHSDYDEGTVIRQSIDAYSDVEEHTRIFIWVSLGPETTPTPEPTPSPTPPAESAGPGYYFAD